MKQERPRLVCLSPHALVTRAAEGVGEGRVAEGGGVRRCEVSRRSVRYQGASGSREATQTGMVNRSVALMIRRAVLKNRKATQTGKVNLK
jgi:hypothetical protein